MTIEDLKRLEAAATPGPWRLETDTCDCGGDYPCSHGRYPYELIVPGRIVRPYQSMPEYSRPAAIANFPEAGDGTMADAELLAAARNALPALLRVAEIAQEVRAALHLNGVDTEAMRESLEGIEERLAAALAALEVHR